jgi:hypothetical protein
MWHKHPPGQNAARLTNFRSDLWPSFEAARAEFQKNPFYNTWDPRAMDRYLRYGLRRTPTAVYPDAAPGSVTLTTTKHQEAWLYVRSCFDPVSPDGKLDEVERFTTGDYTEDQASYKFHRAEPGIAADLLPLIRPHVLFVYGEKSYVNIPGEREKNVFKTGTRTRTNGGVEAGAVRMEILEKGGHLFPVQMVAETAEIMAPFLKEMIAKSQREEQFWQNYDSGKSERNGLAISQKWFKEASKKKYEKRPVAKEKDSKL